jgi:hypothetical protein
MNVTQSPATPQAFGSPTASTTPVGQVRESATSGSVERPDRNATQRVDAAPRSEAPARPDSDARPPANAESTRPGSRVNLVV